MAKLTANARRHIAKKNFALPGGHYPIEDKAHAIAAEARVKQFGTPAQQAEVSRKVRAKYPTLGQKKAAKK